MSGRRQLPLSDWPAADRAAWEALFAEGDLLDGAGPCRHWSVATRHSTAKSYGRWLGWCEAGGGGLHELPGDRATPERVEAYARALMAAVAPKTVDSYIRDLKMTLKVLVPNRDWFWLMGLSSRLKAWARPSRQQTLPDAPASQLFSKVTMELCHLAAADLSVPSMQIAYRDTLLVGMLLAAPIRLRNIAMIRIGVHLHRAGAKWWLSFAAGETKTGHPLDLVLPPSLAPYVDLWLSDVRPRFPGAEGDHFWPARKGRPMAPHTVYACTRGKTERLFGVALSPHAFRSLAATTLSDSSPEDALRAPALLGHRDPAITENHYIRSTQICASQTVSEAVIGIREGRDRTCSTS